MEANTPTEPGKEQDRPDTGDPQEAEAENKGPVAGTPEDVAVLYSWAKLQGAKYRDFSASRREYRAQVRYRAAQKLRERELKAQADAEESASTAVHVARTAQAMANSGAAGEDEMLRSRAMRTAEEAARRAEAERAEASRCSEGAFEAGSAAERERREMLEAHASARRQAREYIETEARRLRRAGPQPLDAQLNGPELNKPELNDAELTNRELNAPELRDVYAGVGASLEEGEAASTVSRPLLHPGRFGEPSVPDTAILTGHGFLHERASLTHEGTVEESWSSGAFGVNTGIGTRMGSALSQALGRHLATQRLEQAAETGDAGEDLSPASGAEVARDSMRYRMTPEPTGSSTSESDPQTDTQSYPERYPETYSETSAEMLEALTPGSEIPDSEVHDQEAPKANFAKTAEEKVRRSGPAWIYGTSIRPLSRAQASVQRFGEDTLLGSRERMASRWFALKGVFEKDAPELPALQPTRQSESQTPVLAVFSLAGGVGKTSLAATLARALSALGEKVGLVDTTSHGLLPFYFDARNRRPDEAGSFPVPPGEKDAPISLVSYEVEGKTTTHEQKALATAILRSGQGRHRVVLDLASSSGWLIRSLADLHPTVLVPISPDMNSVISLHTVERFFLSVMDLDGRPLLPFYVLNQFDASLPLHLDVREVFRRQLGDRLLHFVVRRSQAVSEALAEGMTVMDYAPDAPVSQDYRDVAKWLREISPPAVLDSRRAQESGR